MSGLFNGKISASNLLSINRKVAKGSLLFNVCRLKLACFIKLAFNE